MLTITSRYPAGRSVATSNRVTAGEWDGHERWVQEMSPVDENMRTQSERASEWMEALRRGNEAGEDTVMDGG
jgi:hypothetical protein